MCVCALLPLADSFLVLMIFAAYSCPDDFFTHLRTTENAPLSRENKRFKKSRISRRRARRSL